MNCPLHIYPRYDEEQVGDLVESLRTRIEQLEARLRDLGEEG